MTEKYKPIDQKKASDLIVREIWRLIIDGKLKPGDKLPPERELTKKFNVSMVTLREALQTLTVYGHITKKRGAHGGSVILDVAPTKGINLLVDYIKAKNYKPEDLIEAKRLIEPLIGRLAKERLTDKGVEALAALIKEHQKDYESKGTSRRAYDLYALIGSLTKNPILAVISELFARLMMDIDFSIGVSDLESTEEEKDYNRAGLEAHRKIVDAFLSGDASSAEDELRRTADDYEKALGDLLRNYSN